MKKSLFFPAIVLPLLLCAQQDLKKIAKKSPQAFAYRINASVAEKYIKQDSIDVDAYLNQTPAAIFNADSVDETKLPKGLYVIIQVIDDEVAADLTGVSNLIVYPVNNQRRVQLLLRDKEGNFINDAHVWVNNKEALFDAAAQSYHVSQKNPDEALVKVYAPGDTTFISLAVKDERQRSVFRQHWANFKKTKVGDAITWLLSRIAYMFTNNYRYGRSYRYKPPGIGAAGTMVLNQPKYKQADTVKLKAYVYNKHWKRYNKPLKVYLEYGTDHKQFLANLQPSAPGSYLFQFPLSDTLETDDNYNITFRTKHDKLIIRKDFKIEDYVLDEVAQYNMRSVNETYYANDTMHFYGSATDANGLPLLDASAKLVLTTDNIDAFYKDSLYVSDTLFADEKPLLAQGETVFDIPTKGFPDADLTIRAKLIFKNGNNELQEKNITVHCRQGHEEVFSAQQGDSIKAEYRVNGKSVAKDGIMETEDIIEESKQVHFPLKIKIDPLVSGYKFYVSKNNIDTLSTSTDISTSYNVSLDRISAGDTLGFILANKYNIPVSFSVFDGNTIVAEGKSSDENIRWVTIAKNKRRMYTVKWQYIWAGTEQKKHETIALLYKLLNIQIKSAQSVFPGQKDTIHVNVADYKNRPVDNVNLTAVSYNRQFKRDIYVPDPPYLVKYRLRPHIDRHIFKQDDSYVSTHYPLYNHKGWMKALGLDSMPYYHMLYPAQYIDAVTHINDFMPQVSVHAVQNGRKQEVYMLYINRRLVYYNGVTDKAPYAFISYEGYAQIGIRLYDKFVEIDSIYLQPFYKHDLVFDIDHLPANSTIKDMPVYFTPDEINRLESNLWQLDSKFETNEGYVWQFDKVLHLSSSGRHIIGPFDRADSMHFYAPGYFDIHFKFEAGSLALRYKSNIFNWL